MDTIVIGHDSRNTAAKYIQVIDNHSRYVWAKATKTNSSLQAISVLQSAINEAGRPTKLVTDNGTNFTNKSFKRYTIANEIELARVSPYHPQANGICERVNGTLIRHLKARLIENPSIRWSTALKPTLECYNALPYSSTGYAPESLQFGRNVPSCKTLEGIRSKATVKSIEKQRHNKIRYDSQRKQTTFEIGDKVLVNIPSSHPSNTKFAAPREGPFEIVSKIDVETYKVRRNTDENPQALPDEFTVNSQRLRPYFTRESFRTLNTQLNLTSPLFAIKISTMRKDAKIGVKKDATICVKSNAKSNANSDAKSDA